MRLHQSNQSNQMGLYTNLNPQASLFPIPHSEVDRMTLRNGIRFYTMQCFNIPYPVIAAYFKHYKLLYWGASHVIESIEAGMICRDDIAFIVRFHKDLTRGKILNESRKNPNTQYRLSFRAPLDSWNIDPIVIISE